MLSIVIPSIRCPLGALGLISPFGAFLQFEHRLCWYKWQWYVWRWRRGTLQLGSWNGGGMEEKWKAKSGCSWGKVAFAAQRSHLCSFTLCSEMVQEFSAAFAGGNGGDCPDLYEWLSWNLCWWYLEIHLLLISCGFNCPAGEQNRRLSLVINYPGEYDAMS